MNCVTLNIAERPNQPRPAAFSMPHPSILDAEDVGLVATSFLQFEGRPFYPAGALHRASICEVWLGVGSLAARDPGDLIFCMPGFEDQAEDFRIYEIVLRTTNGADYGGWAFGEDLTLTDDFQAGHRVIETGFRGERLRFVYHPQTGVYGFDDDGLSGLSTGEIRAMAKSRLRY